MGRPGLIKLDDALRGVSILGFDTSPFIYFIERHPTYLPLLRQLFQRVDTGALQVTVRSSP